MYIDKESWLCMLGSSATGIEESDGIYKYESNKRTNILSSRTIAENDIDVLRKYTPFYYHYFSKESCDLLKKHFKITTSAKWSTEIKLSNLDFVGNKYKGIRSSINKAKRYNIEFREDIDIDTFGEFAKRWRETSGEKYFQAHTGKNGFYLKSGYHHGKINLFCYIDGKLASFGVLSNPENGYSSYICGKALCYDYPGLSEYTDVLLYKKGIERGVSVVNLGEARTGLLWYKLKFPGATKIQHYNGNVK